MPRSRVRPAARCARAQEQRWTAGPSRGGAVELPRCMPDEMAIIELEKVSAASMLPLPEDDL